LTSGKPASLPAFESRRAPGCAAIAEEIQDRIEQGERLTGEPIHKAPRMRHCCPAFAVGMNNLVNFDRDAQIFDVRQLPLVRAELGGSLERLKEPGIVNFPNAIAPDFEPFPVGGLDKTFVGDAIAAIVAGTASLASSVRVRDDIDREGDEAKRGEPKPGDFKTVLPDVGGDLCFHFAPSLIVRSKRPCSPKSFRES
jgi:hypothetical protein